MKRLNLSVKVFSLTIMVFQWPLSSLPRLLLGVLVAEVRTDALESRRRIDLPAVLLLSIVKSYD